MQLITARKAMSVSTLMMALFVACVALCGSPARAQSVTVKTSLGTVQGLLTSTTREFLGVRYAAAPVGNLRFAPPQSPGASSGTIQATQFGSPCPQVPSPFSAQSGTNEDCLFLNVYTPITSATNLPVFVWIHGGAFIYGEGADYDPTALVANNVIVVTLNYRLGALGFLAVPSLSSNGGVGNYGLMDQQFALQWVQQNIAAFGGNPKAVTIGGESAGACSVFAHIVSPTAKGLFQRAISESAPCALFFPSEANAEASGTSFAAAAGCSSATAACLRALPVGQLLATAAAQEGTSLTNILEFEPNISGSILPLSQATAILLGDYNHVPVLAGTNHDEFRLFMALGFDLVGSPLTAAEYPVDVQALAAAVVAGTGTELGINISTPNPQTVRQVTNELLAAYPLKNYTVPDEAFAALVTDLTWSCPAKDADELLSIGVPVYAYEFNDENAPMVILPPVSFPYAASHTSELQFLFKVPEIFPATLSANEQKLSSTMQKYWTNFVKTGKPNSSGSASWPGYSYLAAVYNLDDIQSLVPPTPSTEYSFAGNHQCTLWTGILIQSLLSDVASFLF